MPRQVRIEYPGAMYHVMSRGNRRQDSYLDDVDRQDSSRPWPNLEEMDGQVGQHHFGQMRLEVAEAKAECIIGPAAPGLVTLGLLALLGRRSRKQKTGLHARFVSLAKKATTF
jgi:hypothetical protein